MENPRGWIVILCMLGLLAFLFYEGIRAPYRNAAFILIPFFLILYVLLQVWGAVYFGGAVNKGRMFLTKSGLAGTIEKGPIKAIGDNVTYRVMFHRQYVPKERRSDFGRSFPNILSGVDTVEITEPSSFFELVPEEDCEAPEGAIMFHGRIDKRPLKYSESALIQRRFEQLSYLNTELITLFEELEPELANVSQVKVAEFGEVLQKAKDLVGQTIIREPIKKEEE